MTPAPSSETPIATAPSSVPSVSVKARWPLAAVAVVGLVLTACIIGGLILLGQQGQGARSFSSYRAFQILWLLGLAVTAGALVWATIIALRLKRRGWAIWLVLGTLALVVLTLGALPGLLIFVFAAWGPTERISVTLVSQPDVRGNDALRPGRNWLALVSFLLSLGPLVSLLLGILASKVWSNLLDPGLLVLANSPVGSVPDAYSMVGTIVGLAADVYLLGCPASIIAAIVTSSLALRRARDYPLQQAWRGFAVAGLAIGIVCMVLLLCAVGLFVLFVNACTKSTGGC